MKLSYSIHHAVHLILKGWDKQCRGWWYGYEALIDELNTDYYLIVTKDQCKKVMQQLTKKGKLKVMSIMDESTGLWIGKGYFINPEHHENI